jgi:hypothetical protein
VREDLGELGAVDILRMTAPGLLPIAPVMNAQRETIALRAVELQLMPGER